jgi:hypothetical protein
MLGSWENDGVARIWTEPCNAGRHTRPMDYWRDPVPKNVMLVSVASFTFQFFSTQQLRECLEFYQRKTHPSSRLDVRGGSHWEFQQWFDRLPMYLLEDAKRQKVVKALTDALRTAERSEVFNPA